MRVVIGFESLYGNTHRIAEAIASGFHPDDVVVIKAIADADVDEPALDVLVVGTPTHAHGLPRPSSRQAAVDAATKGSEHHRIDEAAKVDAGVREWLARLPANVSVPVAAFDTRFRLPGWLVGHPARRIGLILVRHGARLLLPAESFFVDKHEQLRPGELERARAWGGEIRNRAASHLDNARRTPISTGPPEQ